MDMKIPFKQNENTATQVATMVKRDHMIGVVFGRMVFGLAVLAALSLSNVSPTSNISNGGNAGSVLWGQMANGQIPTVKSIIDNAKAQGKIGERVDGYLGYTGAAVPDRVSAAMNEINIRRKSVYTKLARKQGVEIGIIARLSGEKLIAKTPAGQKVMGANHQWRTK